MHHVVMDTLTLQVHKELKNLVHFAKYKIPAAKVSGSAKDWLQLPKICYSRRRFAAADRMNSTDHL
ncbi:hypothetical protein ACS0TY_010906 [Phlomoides rotata]